MVDVYFNTRRELLVVKKGFPMPPIGEQGKWRKSKKRVIIVSGEIGSALQRQGYYVRKLRDLHSNKDWRRNDPVAVTFDKCAISTNQAAIRALFRVIHRYVGNIADGRSLVAWKPHALRPGANTDRAHGVERVLLLGNGIDPRGVLEFRRHHNEPELNNVFPMLAAEGPDLFNGPQSNLRPFCFVTLSRSPHHQLIPASSGRYWTKLGSLGMSLSAEAVPRLN